MKLVCPACGAVVAAECWLNDEMSRTALAAIAALPAPLPKSILGYMSLFRASSSLGWTKVVRLVEEIRELTGRGYVNVQGKVDRTCPPRIWSLAMDQMVERRIGLSLPLKNHNYLRQVAWQLADQEDAQAEKSRNAIHAPRRQSNERPQNLSSPIDQYVQGLRETKPTDEEMDVWKNSHLK